MRTLSLDIFLADVEQRKLALGCNEGVQTTDALRNKGGRRATRKRALLRGAEQRARAAGRVPVLSYY